MLRDARAMMRVVRLIPLVFAVLLALPAAAAAQAPPPDDRAAAQAFADAAKRLAAAAERVDDDPGWLEDCRALRRDPPQRYVDRATAVVDGLSIRSLIDDLKPDVGRARSDFASTRTADPALISGRASVRQILRVLAAFPAPDPDPCASYEAYVRAGYPPAPARAALALDERLGALTTRGRRRKILAAADRMVSLGVPRADVRAFRQLAD